jgi:hypothetical protein
MPYMAAERCGRSEPSTPRKPGRKLNGRTTHDGILKGERIKLGTKKESQPGEDRVQQYLRINHLAEVGSGAYYHRFSGYLDADCIGIGTDECQRGGTG